MLKKTLIRGVIGSLIGMGGGILIPCLLAIMFKGGDRIVSAGLVERCGGEAYAVLLTLLLSGIMGFFDCAGMTFYEMENWSLFRIMASHLGVIFAAFLPTAYILDWIDSLPDLLIIVAVMLVAYFIVWRIMCVIYRKQVDELNRMQAEALKNRKSA